MVGSGINQPKTIDNLVSFIQKYLKYQDREIIEDYIRKHIDYGTFDYALDDKGEVVAVCRWNINGDIADILDLAIREDFRDKGVGNDFIVRGLKRFPDAKYLRFKRGIRGDEKTRTIRIDRVLKKRIF